MAEAGFLTLGTIRTQALNADGPCGDKSNTARPACCWPTRSAGSSCPAFLLGCLTSRRWKLTTETRCRQDFRPAVAFPIPARHQASRPVRVHTICSLAASASSGNCAAICSWMRFLMTWCIIPPTAWMPSKSGCGLSGPSNAHASSCNCLEASS